MKESEDYDECKVLKVEIDKFKNLNAKIFYLNERKKEFVRKDDFDRAKVVKKNLDRLKGKLSMYLTSNQNKLSNSPNKEEDNQNNNSNNQISVNNDNSGILNKSILSTKLYMSKRLNHSHSQPDLINENLVNYDDLILPTVLKRMQNNNSNTNINNTIDNIIDEEMSSNNYNNNIEPPEDLTQEDYIKYEILLKYISESELKKILSKQVLYKDEGIDILKMKISNILSEDNVAVDNSINEESTINTVKEMCTYILLLMDLINSYLDDPHPTIKYKTLELFKLVIEKINEAKKVIDILKFDFDIFQLIHY